jgi:hypothetical protein
MKFYRYETVEYAVMDSEGEYMNPTYPNPKLEVREFNLFKETPKGYWIGYGSMNYGTLRSNGKWVSKTSKKRYAYPTKEEALNNFILRTEKRIKIMEWQVRVSKIGLVLARQKQRENENQTTKV